MKSKNKSIKKLKTAHDDIRCALVDIRKITQSFDSGLDIDERSSINRSIEAIEKSTDTLKRKITEINESITDKPY